MARRLYLGRLPPDVRADEVQKLFDGYGRVTDCRVMTGFGFVEFESSRDAEDAVHQFNGKSFMGNNIVVEFAKESRPRRDNYDSGERGYPPRARRPPGIRLIVDGISRDTSWQDLKDFGREAGSVSFADIDRDVPGQGILEYISRDDADHAVKILDGKDLRGQPVRVTLSDERAGPDNFRRDERRGDDRRDDRYRDDRHGGDRHNRDETRYRDAPRRSGRSVSPPPRSARDDRARSPPPPRRAPEDRREGLDDRRSGPEPYERRRDDRRRDDREPRYEDRGSSRHATGDGGWSRP